MGAGVPARIAVQRLLLGTEGVEQVQDRLPFDPSLSDCSRNCSRMVACRAASRRVPRTLTEEGGGRDPRLDQRQPNADGSPASDLRQLVARGRVTDPETVIAWR